MILKTKLPLVLLVCLLSQFSFGQKYYVHKKKKSYFELTGGANVSLPKVTDSYSVLSSAQSTKDEESEKTYDKFMKNIGSQFGVRYSYCISNSISVLGGFGYQSLGFKYYSDYSSTDTVNNQEFAREMHHLQKISYFNVPLMVRWDMASSQLMPYVQGGIYMDFRHLAKKVIRYDNVIDGEVLEEKSATSASVSIADYTRKFNMGVMGGIGIQYHTKYFTFGIEGNFNYGFRKIMKDDNRYYDLNGFALQYLDVLDQMKMSSANVQLTASIPLNHSISQNILRRKRY